MDHDRCVRPIGSAFPNATDFPEKLFGFQTGDIVAANVPKGKRCGNHTGRVLVRSSGYFDIETNNGRQAGISHRHMKIIHRKDGYSYV